MGAGVEEWETFFSKEDSFHPLSDFGVQERGGAQYGVGRTRRLRPRVRTSIDLLSDSVLRPSLTCGFFLYSLSLFSSPGCGRATPARSPTRWRILLFDAGEGILFCGITKNEDQPFDHRLNHVIITSNNDNRYIVGYVKYYYLNTHTFG
jgi:hypothetical protein